MDKNEYYSHKEVLYEMVKTMQGREVAFLGEKLNVRCIKAHSVGYLLKNMDAFNFKDKKLNIYHSLAYLVNMPMFNYAMEKRRIQQTSFNNSFDDYYKGYDFAFDFDAKGESWIKPYKDCNVLKTLFDQYGVPYSLKFSGSGFHLSINHVFIPNSSLKAHELCQALAFRIKSIFQLESLDESIYDKRRVWKAPYSYDVKTGNIALPLNNSQFDNFSIDIVNPENVIKYGVRDRGLIERPGTQLNMAEFLSDIMVD